MPDSNINIVEQYQSVISALIPFASRGKLKEGLNKLSSRIQQEHLNEIQYEVNRLISPCKKSASNKQFARGSTSIVKVKGVKVELDELGKRILKEELQQYNNVYSEGVYEALSSETRYRQQLSKENLKRKTDAFSVSCMTSEQQADPQHLKVVPDFTISCEKFDSGRHQNVHFLGCDEMAVQVGYKPKLYGGETFDFTFPPLVNVTYESTTVEYTCTGVEQLPGRNQFAVLFKLGDHPEWREQVSKFINTNAATMSLAPDQEEMRTREKIFKDAIVSNMPSQAVFCAAEKQQLVPRFTLATNNVSADADKELSLSLCKGVFKRLSKEFARSREIFQFQCIAESKGKPQRYVASLRELVTANRLSDFIAMGKRNNSLKVVKLELINVDDEQVVKALNGIDKSVLYGNEEYRFIVYATDVSQELQQFNLNKQDAAPRLPNRFTEKRQKYKVEVCLPEFCDRRREPRYAFNTKAMLKSGWLKSTEATVLDISREGLRIKLEQPLVNVKDQVKVKIPSLNLSNLRYTIVGHDPVKQELRLAMTMASIEKKAELFDKIRAQNFSFFDDRCFQSKQQRIFNYMWQMVCLTAPGVHILLTAGKEAQQQLVIAQADGQNKTIAPFKLTGNKLPTHGWFANVEESSLASDKLTAYAKQSVTSDRALFYINHQEKNYSPIGQGAFCEPAKREQMYNAIKAKKGTMVVHGIEATPYQKLDESWYNKRGEHLNKIDKLAISRIKRFEQDCVCMVSITPVSNLHQNLLMVGGFSEATKTYPALNSGNTSKQSASA